MLFTNCDVQKFLQGEENQNSIKKKAKVNYSLVALVTAFLASEHENPQLKDLPQHI